MTKRAVRFSGIVAFFGVIVACSSTTISTSTSGDGGGGGGGGGGAICSKSDPCPSGEFCFNGVCAYGCTNDTNCAANQYCDTQFTKTCQDKAGPPSCASNGDCASDQICVNGLCSAKPAAPAQCTPPPGANDGCDANSVCLAGQQGQGNTCLTFPPCAQDGTCPVGPQGAVCNDGYIQGKARFCIPGACKTEKNCPSGNACVPFDQGAPIGACSNGGTGQLCDANHPCQTGLSCQSSPGFSGVCMPGGGIPGFDAGF